MIIDRLPKFVPSLSRNMLDDVEHTDDVELITETKADNISDSEIDVRDGCAGKVEQPRR